MSDRETRRLIDEAIAAGKVRRIPAGRSGLSRPVWNARKGCWDYHVQDVATGEWAPAGKDGAPKGSWAWRGRKAPAPETLARRDRVRAMHAKGMTDRAMAEAEGVSVTLIMHDRRRLGLPVNSALPQLRQSQADARALREKAIVARYAAGETATAIAADLRMTPKHVAKILRAHGHSGIVVSPRASGRPAKAVKPPRAPKPRAPRKARRRAAANGQGTRAARIAKRRETVARLIAEGLTRSEIARECGVSLSVAQRDIVALGLLDTCRDGRATRALTASAQDNAEAVAMAAAKGMTAPRIAAAVGISTYQVRRIARRDGLTIARGGDGPVPSDVCRRAVAMRRAGQSFGEIAAALGVERRRIELMLHRARCSARDDAQVARALVCRFHDAGQSPGAIARKLRLDPARVAAILADAERLAA